MLGINQRLVAVVLIALAGLALVGAAASENGNVVASGSVTDSTLQVVVPKRQPVQIAIVLDTTEPLASLFTEGIRNAIDMAVSEYPSVRGFPVQLNTVAAPCPPEDAVALNAAAAQTVVSNVQTVAVIGHLCSFPFANVGDYDGDCDPPTVDNTLSALAIYETHGIVTINGSTTNPCLPSVGPTVFNGLFVPDNLDYTAGTARYRHSRTTSRGTPRTHHASANPRPSSPTSTTTQRYF